MESVTKSEGCKEQPKNKDICYWWAWMAFWWLSHTVSYVLLFFPPQTATFCLCKLWVPFQQRKKKPNYQQSRVTATTTKGCRSGQAAADSACSASAREWYSKHFKPQTRAHEWCRLTSGEPPPHTTSRRTRARLHCLRKSQKEVKMLLFFKIFSISYCFTLANNLYSNPVFNLNAAIQTTKKEHCNTFERRLGTEA